MLVRVLVPDRQLAELIAHQDGLVSRAQLMGAGFTRSQAWQNVRTGRWNQVAPGVYSTFTGELTARMRVWAALLAIGGPAAASHRTALWLDGLVERPPDTTRLCIPIERRVRPPEGVRVVRRRDFPRLVHPASSPPRLRLEASVLDAAEEAGSVDSVLSLVFTATHGRFTTVPRLQAEMARRARHPWRGLLTEIFAEVRQGVVSHLELRYVRDVERPHGLPPGSRNKQERQGTASRYRDVRYKQWNTLVELDGRGAHPDDQRFRDWRRDNASSVAGESTLRYGWHDVASCPCDVADQVVTMLRANGWPGFLRQCVRCRQRGTSTAS